MTPSRDHLVRIGRLSEVKKQVPQAEEFVEEAFRVRFFGRQKKLEMGKSGEMWEVWSELGVPETRDKELDAAIAGMAEGDTVLLGFDRIASSNNYDMRLRELTRRHPPRLNIRQVAIRDKSSHGGEKVLMAVRRQKVDSRE